VKVCCTCKQAKSFGDYGKAHGRKDGLYAQCNNCRNVFAKRLYQKHRRKIIARQQAYSKRPEVAVRIKKYIKKYYARTRESQLAKAKAWRRNNLDRRRAYIHDWNNKNRKKVRAYQKAYKIRRYGTKPELTEMGWHLLLATFRNRCAYCGNELLKLEQDHVLALSRGGRHIIGNLVPACRTCNATKAHYDAPKFWWKKTVNE
jgi:hypothetical protein